MTPQLSIVKTRFAKASLRPRCARHRSWGATCLFPNACVGHSASQLMRWTLSFPIDALDTQLPSSRDGSSSKIQVAALSFTLFAAGFQQSCPLQLVHLPGFTGWCQSIIAVGITPSLAVPLSKPIQVAQVHNPGAQGCWLSASHSRPFKGGNLRGADLYTALQVANKGGNLRLRPRRRLTLFTGTFQRCSYLRGDLSNTGYDSWCSLVRRRLLHS